MLSFSLRTLTGEPVEHVAELEFNGYYVAVGPHEHFARANYTPMGRPRFFVATKIKNPYVPLEEMSPRKHVSVSLKKHQDDLEVP